MFSFSCLLLLYRLNGFSNGSESNPNKMLALSLKWCLTLSVYCFAVSTSDARRQNSANINKIPDTVDEFKHQENDDKSTGLEYDRHQNSALAHVKRQISFLQCPNQPAKSRPSRLRSFVAIYSPKSRSDINIYQRKKDWQDEDVDHLLENGFDLSKPTLLYTHGYLQTIRSPWLQEARSRFDELFPLGSKERAPYYNLLFYDWSDYGHQAYGTAVSYVPFLGKVLSQFLANLGKRYGYNMSRLHIISYSLSTHIAGQTGQKMGARNRIGQITALDPTSVCFQQGTSFSDKYSLKPSDAKLVVAKHYDMGRLGARRPTGGVDVFVNGGSDQPTMIPRTLSGLQLVASPGGFSSHTRASEHEVEPFDDTCHEIAYACRTYDAFLAGQCGDCGRTGNKCYYMNTLARLQLKDRHHNAMIDYKPGTKMYITTGRLEFCLHHYQVIAKLNSNATESSKKALESGAVTINLSSDFKVTPSHLVGSSQYTSLVTLRKRVKNFDFELEVSISQSNLSTRKFLSSLKYLYVHYMSNVSAKERLRASARFCPNSKGNSLIKCS